MAAAFNPMASTVMTMRLHLMIMMILGFMVIAGVAATPTPETVRCQEYYYHDHGTDHCEHCSDICNDASLKRTVEECWEKCKSYALILWPPKTGKSEEGNGEKTDESSIPRNEKTDDSSFPLVGRIVIPVVAIVCIALVVLGAIYVMKRRSNAKKNCRTPPVQFHDQTAVVLLDDTARPHDLPPDVSMGAARGSEASRSTAGIQEEGTGSSAQGTSREGGVTTVVQVTSSHRDAFPAGSRHPVVVSHEGDMASYSMALPRPIVRPRATTQRLQSQMNDDLDGTERPAATAQRHQPLADDDLDSTELKTLLPAMSEDSLLDEACGGTNTITTTAYPF